VIGVVATGGAGAPMAMARLAGQLAVKGGKAALKATGRGIASVGRTAGRLEFRVTGVGTFLPSVKMGLYRSPWD
jgi:hypothetical protein